MKHFCIFLLLSVTVYNGMAQSKQQVGRLASLGKIWGYLKYYHPAAAKKAPDWDKELIRMIPLVKQTKNDLDFMTLLESWYRSLPAATLASTPVNWSADSITRVFTEKEIEKFRVSKFLTGEFVRLYNYHLPDSNAYFTRTYGGHYYDHIIHTEDGFEGNRYPDEHLRLLSLFRYWNTINYFYPHKSRIADWDAVLNKYIPVFLDAEDSSAYQYSVKQLVHELPDSHSFLQIPNTNYYFTPFRIGFVEGKYLIIDCDDSIALKWDYQVGDEIVSVNNKPVTEREKELGKIVTGTNRLSVQRNIAADLLKTGDTVITVGLNRNGKLMSKRVELHSWPIHSKLPRSAPKPLWQELEPGVWYVRFCRISKPDTLQYLFRDIQKAKAVIWEMRDYPNFQVVTELFKFLLPPKTQLTEELTASDKYPGSFVKSPYYFEGSSSNSTIFNAPLLVLVDEQTQSLSESVVAGLKLRSNTITIGRQTAGTTGNITWFSLPGGIEVSYTGVGVTGLQDGFKQGVGVKLDMPITLTKEALLKYKDYILYRALEYARTSLK